MDSPPLPVPVGSPPCTMKSCSEFILKTQIHDHCQLSSLMKHQDEWQRENLDDAMKFDAIVVTPARKFEKVPASSGCVLIVELDSERTHGGLQCHLRRPTVGARPHRLLAWERVCVREREREKERENREFTRWTVDPSRPPIEMCFGLFVVCNLKL